MNRPVSLSLRVHRALAYPYEFQNAYGEEMLQTGEEAIEPTWRSLGVWGLLVLLFGAPLLPGVLARVAYYIPARQSLQLDPATALRQE